jgi:hypothetical protein
VINQNIRKKFFCVTQVELDRSVTYSQNICETCFDLLHDFVNFRSELIQNQQKLLDDLLAEDDVAMLIEEVDSECAFDEALPSTEQIFESQSDFLVKEEVEQIEIKLLVAELEDDQMTVADDEAPAVTQEIKPATKAGRTKLCPGNQKTFVL